MLSFTLNIVWKELVYFMDMLYTLMQFLKAQKHMLHYKQGPNPQQLIGIKQDFY